MSQQYAFPFFFKGDKVSFFEGCCTLLHEWMDLLTRSLQEDGMARNGEILQFSMSTGSFLDLRNMYETPGCFQYRCWDAPTSSNQKWDININQLFPCQFHAISIPFHIFGTFFCPPPKKRPAVFSRVFPFRWFWYTPGWRILQETWARIARGQGRKGGWRLWRIL